MLAAFGDRQQALLRALLRHKDGLTTDALVEALDVTRTAVRQHLTALQRDGYVEEGDLQGTSGRPGRLYRLTPAGQELFVKQYAWLSEAMLDALRRKLGSDGLTAWLVELAETIAGGLTPALEGKPPVQRLAAVRGIMNDMAFEAAIVGDAIEASNCIYQKLAPANPELCEFDKALLSRLAGAQLGHEECIARQGNVCRFRLL